jgi:hypothetical protein
MNMRSIATHLGAGVLGALVSAVLVFQVGVRPVLRTLGQATVRESAEKAYSAYRFGSYPKARAAIIDHVHLETEVARQEQNLRADQQPKGELLWADVVVWYGRLAVAAERAGQTAEQKKFVSWADTAARQTGGAIGEPELRAIVEKQDAAWHAEMSQP